MIKITKTCFILTYQELKKAKEDFDRLVQFAKDNPSGHLDEIVLTEAKNKLITIEPYWIGIVGEPCNIHFMDDWLCKIRTNADDLYTGQARYLELVSLSEEIEKVEL